ncbi:hypothetical protein [Guyparkeria sp. SB14A]|uniref:hypothetical protein n=1 Tax=Guyparkeria sp. SB14A TaxID=2571147 RepID=UPI001FFCED6D|nr:hypothetical protein [Guyparkeria sp. SB14A]
MAQGKGPDGRGQQQRHQPREHAPRQAQQVTAGARPISNTTCRSSRRNHNSTGTLSSGESR